MKIQNFNQPELALVRDGEYILTKDYALHWTIGDFHFKIVVPAGFNTDIASVPQFVWSLGVAPDGLHRGAAIVHDFLYLNTGKLPLGTYFVSQVGQHWTPSVVHFRRSECDKLFLEVMREAGVSAFKRKAMYYAVRLFGKKGWNDAK